MGSRAALHSAGGRHLYRVDDIRNCFRCRDDPDDHGCQHWEEARKAIRVLKQQARLFVKDADQLMDATGGKPAMLYRFLDGSAAFFSWGAPSWQGAGEITGTALETALDVLEARGQPGGKHGWGAWRKAGNNTDP